MKKILMLAPRLPWPERSGGEIRVASLLRGLSRRYRFTLLTFAPVDDALSAATAAALAERATGARVILVPRPRRGPAPSGLPPLAEEFRSAEMSRALEDAARRERPDLIHLEFTQMAQYAEAAARWAPVFLTEHDSSVLWPKRSYFRHERSEGRELLAAYLRRAFTACARVVVVSRADAVRLAPLARRGRFVVVPTGVDLKRFPFAPLEGRNPGEAAFLGHYRHYPNEEAAVRLCREIMPRLRRLAPEGLRLRLLGSAPTAAVEALAGPDVEIKKDVEDIAPHLRRARVFLAPMRLGYGIKGKILEAFASGAPVVASRGAVEAMPGLVSGRHLLIADGADRTARAAARLLGDDALSRALAANARAYVERRFGWDAQAALLDAAYRRALSE